MNKKRRGGFNFDLWVTELKTDFFHNSSKNTDEFQRLSSYKKLHEAIDEFLGNSNDNTDHAVIKASQDLKILIENSFEVQFLKNNVESWSKVPPKKARRAPWRNHLELVIYAIEKISFEKEQLLQLRKTLQVDLNHEIGHNEESIYNWSLALPESFRHELPAFRTVNMIQNKAPSSQWAHSMRNAYLTHLMKIYRQAIERGTPEILPTDLTRDGIVDFIVNKYSAHFSALEERNSSFNKAASVTIYSHNRIIVWMRSFKRLSYTHFSADIFGPFRRERNVTSKN